MELITRLFDSSGFPARWQCGPGWAASPWLGWLHILSDLGVWSAYVAIPCVLGYFVLRRRDIPFRTIFLLFGAFILACGTTHLMEAIIFWWPAYRLAGAIKLFTAVVSWSTVFALVPVIPKVLAMRSPEELEREISARKEAEHSLHHANVELERQIQELRISQERFRLLVEGTKDHAIFMLDPSGRVASWNPGAERITQYRSDEIVGQHFSCFYTADDLQLGKPDQELRVAASAGRYEDEGWRVRKDGTTYWADVVISALYDDAGKLRGFSKITRDMTEKKRADEIAQRLLQEEAARQAAETNAQLIQEHRERLQVTLASIGDAVISTDAEGRITFLNPVAEQLTGWRQADANARSILDVFKILNEQTRQPVENPVLQALNEKVIVGLAHQTILITRDGEERPIDDSAAPIRGESGTILGAVLVFRDVTERRKVEDQLRSSEQRFARFMQNLPGLAWIKDLQGRYVFANVAAQRAFSRQQADLYGKTDDEVFPPETAVQFRQNDQQAISSGTGIQVVEALQQADGAIHYSLVSKFPIPDSEGQKSLVGGMAIDITEQRRIEQALRDADRLKDEFLATLAHELRNPLAPIRNSLQILKMPRVDAAIAQQTRDMMERQVQHLVRLVDDLLDVSRVMRGKVELRKEPVQLATIVARAVETAQSLIELQEHELDISISPESLLLDADPIRLVQVVGNLLTNSAKYSEPHGHIWLTAEREGDRAVLKVRDAGIGIAPDILPHVFELFVQADHSSTKAQGGLGIGLTLVKNLVEMHEGTVEAHSAGLGKGCEFVIRLPLMLRQVEQTSDYESDLEKQTPPHSGCRLLVVDDNHDAAMSLSLMLQLQGHEVRTAHNGPAALEIAATYHPDLIFLDIGMPDMDGYEVARRMRQQPGLEKVVLAALTGWGQEEDRRRTTAAGFNHHLVKPAEPKELNLVLSQLKRDPA